jgi:hypothetical protein
LICLRSIICSTTWKTMNSLNEIVAEDDQRIWKNLQWN